MIWVSQFIPEWDFEFQFFVLKQSWRAREASSEGKLYKEVNGKECEYVGRIDLCEEVLISGKADSTDALIRRGLDNLTGLGKRFTDQREWGEENTDPYIHVASTDVGDVEEVIARETGAPVPRVRTRVVLSTYGWSIKHFSTRRELLVVLRDAIKGTNQRLQLKPGLTIFIGHKHLYKRGVLHRDISPSNILIKWRPGTEADQPSTSGCLIDLERGKKGKFAEDKMKNSAADNMIHAIETAIHAATDIEVEKEVARLSLEFPFMNSHDGHPIAIRVRALIHAVTAIGSASKFRGLPMDGLCTPQHLRWKQVKLHCSPFLLL